MKGGIIKTLLVFAVLALLSGCAVDNQHLAKLPLFEAKSDTVPGFDAPLHRAKLIREKGNKGAKANDAEKEILVAQLVYEYQTSPDPNMRRESVDALARIPHPDRDRYLREILDDENPFVRLSALEALGKTYNGQREELAEVFIDRMKRDSDKDVRVIAVRSISYVAPKDSADDLHRTIVLELGDLLDDRVPAVRYESMRSLKRVTGKDYGDDINRWLQFVRYTRGEVPDLPSKRSLAERVPTIALPMFK